MNGTEAPGMDTRRIMEEIRTRVAEKKATGAYSDREIEEISRMEISLQEREGYGEEMDRIISWLHTHWEATGPVDREGMPPPSTARAAVKSFLLALMKPEMRLLLAKQNQINSRIVQLLSGAMPPLRDGFRDVDERIESLALRLEEENGALREKVRELGERLDRLEGRGREQ